MEQFNLRRKPCNRISSFSSNKEPYKYKISINFFSFIFDRNFIYEIAFAFEDVMLPFEMHYITEI